MQEKSYTSAYASVVKKEIDWLWYPYIAFGKITLLQGDPGDGKSTFIIQLAALLSKGKAMPDGTKGGRPMNIIYQCSEDDPADTIRPRLEAAGADCNRIHFIVDEGDLAFDDYRVELSILQTGASLMIFDPIQAYLPQNADMLSAVKMRQVLKKVAAVAEKCHCAVVLISHMNKGGNNNNLYRSLGSVDIPAIARSVLMISRDSENPSVRYVEQIKNNLAPEGVPISFAVTKKDGFCWNVHLVNGNVETTGDRPIDRAEAIISSVLENGEAESHSLFENALLSGISEATIRRALRKIGATCYKKGSVWYWHLPDD